MGEMMAVPTVARLISQLAAIRTAPDSKDSTVYQWVQGARAGLAWAINGDVDRRLETAAEAAGATALLGSSKPGLQEQQAFHKALKAAAPDGEDVTGMLAALRWAMTGEVVVAMGEVMKAAPVAYPKDRPLNVTYVYRLHGPLNEQYHWPHEGSQMGECGREPLHPVTIKDPGQVPVERRCDHAGCKPLWADITAP